MAIDPSTFHLINVADTCSVWNILSSKLLYAAAIEARCDFCITNFVHYECLIKRRKSISDANRELMDRLRSAQTKGTFRNHSCDIGDLQQIAVLERRNRLGKGELSSIAFAMKIGQAFITDDMEARKLAQEAGHGQIQTTSHLFAWLIFTNRLSDGSKAKVIEQHKAMGRPLAPHLNNAYDLALQCRVRTVTPLIPPNG